MEVQDRSLSQQQLDAYHRDGMVNRSEFSLLLRFPLRIGRKSACFLLNRPGSSTGEAQPIVVLQQVFWSLRDLQARARSQK